MARDEQPRWLPVGVTPVDVAVVGLAGGLLAVLLTTMIPGDDVQEVQEEVEQGADVAPVREPTLPVSEPPVAELETDDADDKPRRVGGDIEPPQILSQVKPRYPEVAKAARVQGIVILEAIINKEGVVDDVRVLRGHPLLEQAAKDAIVQWKFRPGRLEGKPVKVYFTLTVNFTLK